jgi:hypothetical protein
MGCSGLESVQFPSSVTSIGSSVFSGCSNISVFQWPAGLSSIPDRTFEYCASLANFEIPNGVTNIGDAAFSSCSQLASITIPSSVTSIGPFAFYYCFLLSNVSLPNNLKKIGEHAFEGCIDLPAVTIPASVSSIGPGALAACDSLANISVDAANPNFKTLNGVLFTKDGTTVLECPSMRTGSYFIPSSVKTIGECAFYTCRQLNSVTIFNGVTNIGNQAFDSCVSLTNIAIPSSVVSIGYTAFRNCSSLKAISVASLNPAFSSLDGVLFDKNQTTLIQYPSGKLGNYNLPQSVRSIADWAFAYSLALQKVVIDRNVTNIGNYAFSGCTNLSTAFFMGTIPDLYWEGLFLGDTNVLTYYLPGNSGQWSTTYPFVPPMILWNPHIQHGNQSPGMRTNGFGFTLAGSTNLVLVVEACTNLAAPVWTPIATNTLADGSSDFTDLDSKNHPSRFYRLSPP